MKPFVLVNCAMSADGKLAGPERKQVRISSEEDMARVKNLRKRYDAILVGVGTVIADDPHLTVKNATYEENPVRIVLDSHGRIPPEARVLDDRAPTIIVTNNECTKDWGSNVTVIRGGSGRINLTDVLHILAKDLGIENMIVEGGGEVIASFFREKLVDRYSVFVGGLLIGGRTSPTPADGDGWLAPEGVKLSLDSAEVLGNGALLTFTPKY
ncbi:MAG: 2,5-diamino-6-(ribosylamino)-4(3H)-pyrimidinone 5'-phosphate reductase [Candidatus Methanomethylophilus sp.]|nr:2,5-diamino-6-(ribosylamino)-4(3H)-pyrimidinone 5'-phosphate reductase [Methanomethylophilus sp.]MBQ5397490.1 2,5-diamino-6-(ribosylamino)-4(3H)-pyrimidinone 5'-phosphate reductase [Methanomethylophilus sp.]MBQ5448247.1 2,5-diamino-6-(ribosylamino)-4(3H)-pyrimidinone 5'-phosphate reductase [Methanomethylophilus sp.]MBQ5483216.1 2,5-diamino-6-(ribosylamino)-4(3H)-pyrimidinone 5'-phosphate reductase [Methanomethylophilus sp.]